MKRGKVFGNILVLFLFFLLAHNARASLIITEVLPAPADGNEFVEIHNAGSHPIDLSGWRVDDIIGGGKSPKALSGVIESGGYLAVYFTATFNSSNNSTDTANLLDASEQVINSVSYTYKSAFATSSYSLINGVWEWTTTITPGAQNASQPQSAPQQQNSQAHDNAQPSTGGNQTHQGKPDYLNGIILSEALPNPKGDDETIEFIEIFNTNGYSVDISAWQLDDAAGGSHAYAIPNGTFISPFSYAVFYSDDTNIAFNNSGGDSLRLLRPDASVADMISYADSAKEGLAYAKTTHGSWGWTTTITPGAKNIFETQQQSYAQNEPASVKTENKITQPSNTAAMTQPPQSSVSSKHRTTAKETLNENATHPGAEKTNIPDSQNVLGASIATMPPTEPRQPLIDFKSALLLSAGAGIVSIIMRKVFAKK